MLGNRPLRPAPNRPAPASQRPAGAQQQFRFAGAQVQVRFTMHADQSELSDVLLEGNAELREAKTAKPDEKPLIATGDRLQLSGGDSPDSQVSVVGTPAYVEARGMSLTGANIQLQRRSNRLWVDGAGRMTMPSRRRAAQAGDRRRRRISKSTGKGG